MVIHKALIKVNGSLQIIQATEFVETTLRNTGLGLWLTDRVPDDMPPVADSGQVEGREIPVETYPLEENASMTLKQAPSWLPWNKPTSEDSFRLRFNKTDFALGVGSTALSFEEAKEHLGEFLAVAGHVVCQPPGENEKPDFLVAEKDYIPELLCIQALHCSGNMAHLLRFAGSEAKAYTGFGEIVEMAMQQCESVEIAFVILAEIDGLVGSNLIRSPGLLTEDREMSFPGIKEWISFCGERVYARQQALVLGVAAATAASPSRQLLVKLPSRPHIRMHAHAAVFPYQPLQNGNIDLSNTVQQFFNGPPPMALLHLVEDARPAVGLGESAFTTGACWCAPLKNLEGLS